MTMVAGKNVGWPPRSNGRINWPGGDYIRIDTCNSRYIAKKGGVKLRAPWGGKKKGFPSIQLAWDDSCNWLGLDPSSADTRGFVAETGLGSASPLGIVVVEDAAQVAVAVAEGCSASSGAAAPAEETASASSGAAAGVHSPVTGGM